MSDDKRRAADYKAPSGKFCLPGTNYVREVLVRALDLFADLLKDEESVESQRVIFSPQDS
jgi:hypothetical protein